MEALAVSATGIEARKGRDSERGSVRSTRARPPEGVAHMDYTLRSLNDIDVACYISGADRPSEVAELLEYLAERLRAALS